MSYHWHADQKFLAKQRSLAGGQPVRPKARVVPWWKVKKQRRHHRRIMQEVLALVGTDPVVDRVVAMLREA